MNDKELINFAIEAMQNSYAPYSSFNVGAALLTKNGKLYTGCNIENAAFTPSICAERVAFSKAVSEGERKFSKIAIVSGKNGNIINYAYPCGVCRQVMAEFCDKDFIVIVAKSENEYLCKNIDEILPCMFTSQDIDI